MARNARPGIEVLPPELWTKIFEDIPRSMDQESPRESWAQVSLTCHTFRSYMMPIMHLLFTFHPYAVDLTDPWGDFQTAIGSMPSTDTVERELERLAFYSSDPIVNYVRGVVLRPWSFKVVESSSGSHGLEYLSSKFFESLYRFRNLRSVIFVLANLNSLALQNLVHLPKLEHLGVFNCSLQTPVDVSLSLRSFAFNHEAEYEDLEELGAGTWLDLLNPDRLGYLLIDVDHPPLAILERIRTSSPFNSLSKVTINVTSDLLPHLQSLLTNVPRIRSLEVSRPPDPPQDECVLLSEGLNTLAVGPLTLLEEFIGPRELLYVILVRQSIEARPQRLQRLHITSIPGEGEHFDTIWTMLSSPTVSAQLHWLSHFHVEFRFMENEHFSKLLLLFPDLESLELEAADAMSRPSLTNEVSQFIYTETNAADLLNCTGIFGCCMQAVLVSSTTLSLYRLVIQ
ncbi:hypothetical protein CPB84DRAFT_1797234 [Gymnopilus junonius]|uniref:Uncharacterized protein n=1 Tax=Gymnopilus junonius TaxID=109634 RepID=A0A9P5NBF1_GYMJU|nr:hypothetical protein CPB84DRAFT_1797234 [Gymnopilus junonius]